MSESTGPGTTPGTRDDDAEGGAENPYELLTGDDGPAATDDGETVGAADRDADAERSR